MNVKHSPFDELNFCTFFQLISGLVVLFVVSRLDFLCASVVGRTMCAEKTENDFGLARH